MNFCPECETYLTTKILNNDNTNKILSYKCNNCSYSKVIDIVKEPEYKCVYQQNYNLKKIKIDQKNIQFLSKDPTLPHVNNILCPNIQCSTNKQNDKSEILNSTTSNVDNLTSNLEQMNINSTTSDVDNLTSNLEQMNINNTNNKNSDVVYIKLNESDLTYLYQCCICKHTWTNK